MSDPVYPTRMSEPTRKTNPELVRDCVEWLLKRIGHERNDYNDGFVVRRHADPTKVMEEGDHLEFADKKRMLKLRTARRQRDPQSSYKNNKRQKQTLELLVVLEHTEEMTQDGLNLDDVWDRVIYDVTWNIQTDQQLLESATALGMTQATKPSCHGLEVDDATPHPITRYPMMTGFITLSYEFDHRPRTS